MNDASPSPRLPARIRAVLLQRCPRCLQGAAYRRRITMYEHCPNCGWRYEREPGYFTGAMYASYALGFAIVLPVWFIMLIFGASFGWIMAVVLVLLAVTGPVMFRYSRIMWMHFDAVFNGTPDDGE